MELACQKRHIMPYKSSKKRLYFSNKDQRQARETYGCGAPTILAVNACKSVKHVLLDQSLSLSCIFHLRIHVSSHPIPPLLGASFQLRLPIQFSFLIISLPLPPMTSTTEEIVSEIPNLIKHYKDGTVERFFGSPHVPPSLQDPETGVSSKDITVSHNPLISARLYLPQNQTLKLPILVYFHCGGFCFESAFSFLHHRYLNRLVSEAQILAVSVEYRLAPESPLPAAYEDGWAALQWVASHSLNQEGTSPKEPWLVDFGDFDRLYIGGDSAGGNLAHNIAIKAGVESLNGGVKILGALLSHPYFWGSMPIGSEAKGEDFAKSLSCLGWNFVYPSADGGIDNPMINPMVSGAPSLAGLGCSRLLVCVAGKDELRDRGVWYYDSVRESGWRGEVELFDMEGEEHCFHILYEKEETENVKKMIKRLADFLV